ncbi:MAG: diaminopimelate epimerase [Planctomycetota bacterium]|nr:MAG: diaminopimelate epimerase [Planctomycetota bacterium]
MLNLPFVKMHGCGNDYVYLDCWDGLPPLPLPDLARRLSPRHTGIGGDGLIALLPPSGPDHQATMRMFNADGSESEMCGNGLRCLAYLARRQQRVTAARFVVSTGAGPLAVEIIEEGPLTAEVRVDMGTPRLHPEQVPVRLPSTEAGPLLRLSLPLAGKAGSAPVEAIAVGMGNPHAVILVDDVAAIDVAGLGPGLEHHPAFPQRSNIEWAQVLNDGRSEGIAHLRQRTWERGSGITQACGTGACAVAVAARLCQAVVGEQVRMSLDGGDLLITWPGPGQSVLMQGEACWIYSGQIPL